MKKRERKNAMQGSFSFIYLFFKMTKKIIFIISQVNIYLYNVQNVDFKAKINILIYIYIFIFIFKIVNTQYNLNFYMIFSFFILCRFLLLLLLLLFSFDSQRLFILRSRIIVGARLLKITIKLFLKFYSAQ